MSPPRGHRILLVEDTPLVSNLLGAARDGFQVDTAATVAAALDYLATRHYSVIIADSPMPISPPWIG